MQCPEWNKSHIKKLKNCEFFLQLAINILLKWHPRDHSLIFCVGLLAGIECGEINRLMVNSAHASGEITVCCGTAMKLVWFICRWRSRSTKSANCSTTVLNYSYTLEPRLHRNAANYPRESFREGLWNHRRTFGLSVCLFVCYHDN